MELQELEPDVESNNNTGRANRRDIIYHTGLSTVRIVSYHKPLNLMTGETIPTGAQALGSGVVVPTNELANNSEGSGYVHMVLTCYHVVEGVNRVTVQVPHKSGRTHYDFRVVSVCPQHDLAIIVGFLPFTLPPARLGNSDDLRPGTPVVAVGFPLLRDESVAPVPGFVKRYLVQFGRHELSVGINGGHSGGGLFHGETGELVGILAAKLAGDQIENSGLSVPIHSYRMMGTAFPKTVVRLPELAFSFQGVTDDMREALPYQIHGGVVVTSLIPGGAADRAGLKMKDIVLNVGFNNTVFPIDQPEGRVGKESATWADQPVPLHDILRRIPARGAPMTMTILRLGFCTGEKQELIVAHALPSDNSVQGARRHVAIGLEEWPVVSIAGASFTSLRTNLLEFSNESVMALYLTLTPDQIAKERVVVTYVHGDSPAEASGLQAGQEVVSVNGISIDTPSTLRMALQKPQCRGQTCVMELRHLHEIRFLVFNVKRQLEYEENQPHYAPDRDIIQTWRAL